MKKARFAAIFGFLVLLGMVAKGQVMVEDTTRNEPFFKATRFASDAYVGFEAVPTQILNTKAAMVMGFNLGWVLNHRYVVSAKYHLLSSRINVRPIVAPGGKSSIYLTHHFAGLGFSYIFFSTKRFSLQPELTGGWCSVKFEYPVDSKNRHDMGAIIPAVYGIYNAHKNFRIGVGLNYRAVVGTPFFGLKPTQLSGVGGVVFMRVGTF